MTNMIEVVMTDSDQLTLHGIENTMQAAGYPEPQYWYMFNGDYRQVDREQLVKNLAFFAEDGMGLGISHWEEAADYIDWKLESPLRWVIDDPRLRMRRSSGTRRCIVDYYQEQT